MAEGANCRGVDPLPCTLEAKDIALSRRKPGFECGFVGAPGDAVLLVFRIRLLGRRHYHLSDHAPQDIPQYASGERPGFAEEQRA